AELELVELAGEAEILACLGQHFRTDEAEVALELFVQGRYRLVGIGNLVFAEELVDSIDQELRSVQIVLDLDAAGRQEALLQSLPRLRLQELGDGPVPALHPRVLAHPGERKRPPL